MSDASVDAFHPLSDALLHKVFVGAVSAFYKSNIRYLYSSCKCHDEAFQVLVVAVSGMMRHFRYLWWLRQWLRSRVRYLKNSHHLFFGAASVPQEPF